MAIVAISLLLAPSGVAAQAREGRGIDLAPPERAAPSGFALDVGVFLEAPLAVGGMMQLEMPGRIFLRTRLGALPDALGAAYASLGASIAGWDAATEATVADALGGALLFDAALGVRVVDGLELSVGYVLLWAQARITNGSGIGATIETSNHAIHPTLGWRALLGDALYFRIEAGWIHTLGASAQVTPDQAGIDPSALEEEIAAGLRQSAFSPTLSLSLGLHLE